MFLSMCVLGFMILFFLLWGDYMKILIFLEIFSLMFLFLLLFLMKLDYLSLNFFFFVLVFLVCESSLGFLLFIIYISMEFEVVTKMNLIQF